MKNNPVTRTSSAGRPQQLPEIRERARFRPQRPSFHRSDVAIEEEIWDGILRDHALGPKYQENLIIEVENGRVKLRGHTLKEWHGPLIANIIDRVEGVTLMRNELVADPVLQEQVIRALVQDDLTSPYIFMVRCHFGWIHLGGLVPSREIAKAAEGAAGFVPAVRGVLTLPSVFGWLTADEPEPPRRTLQPRIAAAVYQDGDDSQPVEAGMVSQVIIDPASRLVEAFAVRVPEQDGESQVPLERQVPMSAVEAANERQVWLKEGEKLENYPLFERSRCPLPPAIWRPPFPYLPGMVRWVL